MTDTGRSRQKLPKRRSITLPDQAYQPAKAGRGDLHRFQGLGRFVAGRAIGAPLFEVRRIRQMVEDRGEQHDCGPIHPGDEFRLTGRFPGISLSVSVARCI